jgi:hypothetical protein
VSSRPNEKRTSSGGRDTTRRGGDGRIGKQDKEIMGIRDEECIRSCNEDQWNGLPSAVCFTAERPSEPKSRRMCLLAEKWYRAHVGINQVKSVIGSAITSVLALERRRPPGART